MSDDAITSHDLEPHRQTYAAFIRLARIVSLGSALVLILMAIFLV